MKTTKLTRTLIRVALAIAVAGLLQGCAGSSPLASPFSMIPGMNNDRAENREAADPVQQPVVKAEVEATYQAALDQIRASNRAAARELLEKVTQAEPGLAGPWINLARLDMQDENYIAAREALDKAVAANPSNCVAYTEYGVLLRKLGEFEAAQEMYQACLAVSPSHADTYYNLGILYELYLGRMQDALIAYRQYLELSPEPEPKVRGWISELERRLNT